MRIVLMLRPLVRASAAAALLVLPLLAACGGESGSSDGKVHVAASFYPLAWIAERIGGEHVVVESLTKAGAEPHDLELTPADVATISEADVVLYLKGFQPAIDDAVDEADADAVLDVRPSADLDLTFTPIEEGGEVTEKAGSVDPHFWLDPTRLTGVAQEIGAKLAAIDRDHRPDFRHNLLRLRTELEALDRDFASGLRECAHKELVTSHNAFNYLARRYGFTQVGITGLTPEEEPSPADLGNVTRFAKTHGVTTIYFETLVSPDIARTVAEEAGVATDVLDPIEGLNDESQGRDYLEVMAANLENLRKGQDCT
jgi:zinc transport system substrate-binding protein